MEGWDVSTRAAVAKIPLLRTSAGPKDGERWIQRLREEYQSLIKYIAANKENDNDWFQIQSNKDGTKWTGKCW